MIGMDRQQWSRWHHAAAALFLLAIVVLPRLWAASRAVAPARDAFRYWSAAACLSEFPLSFSVQAIDCQPLYPATLASIGSVAFTMEPVDCWRRAQAWSIFCAAWFYLAAYVAGLRIFPIPIAWLGCALVSLLPRQIRYSVDVLSDNLHAALWMTALAALVWSWDRRSRGRFVLLAAAGLVTGLAFWTRFEALLLPAAFVVAMTARQCFAIDRLTLAEWGLRFSLYLVPAWLAVAGYGQLRGELAARHTVQVLVGSVHREERIGASHNSLTVVQEGESAPSVEEPRTPIDRWLLDTATPSAFEVAVGSLARVAWEFFQETRGWLGVLFVLGTFATRRYVFGGTAWLLPASALVGYALVLTLVRWKVGFLAGRYWMPVLPFCGMMGAAAIVAVAQRLRVPSAMSGIANRRWAWAWCALVAASAMGLNATAWYEPLHPDRFGHRQAAVWLAEHTKADQALFDPGWACGFFAERPLWHPVASKIPDCEYAVIEPGLAARPPVQLKEALDYVARHGRVVAEFPKRPGGRAVGVRIIALPANDRLASKKDANQ